MAAISIFFILFNVINIVKRRGMVWYAEMGNQKMFDVLWMMDEGRWKREVGCLRAEG